jgi:glycosyltransferase involved in cell wall biosynthesis
VDAFDYVIWNVKRKPTWRPNPAQDLKAWCTNQAGVKVSSPDLSAVVTFHREGILAHTALNSYISARSAAERSGINVEFILVLDCADENTSDIVKNHPLLDGTEVILELGEGDSALARNQGIKVARGRYVATLDGDDLISTAYFLSHIQEASKGGAQVILHPEVVVSFGMYNAFNWQVDQAGEYFDKPSLLMVNPWISAAFAERSVFERVPYLACHPAKTGFGYEDWYWNCETIAHGFVHRLAWGSVYFYRRKNIGSRNESSIAIRSIVPRTRLFSLDPSERSTA